MQSDEIDINVSEDEEYSQPSRIWSTDGVVAFKRTQALSGFGAAIGMLRDEGIVDSFEQLTMNKLSIGAEPDEFIRSLNDNIALINSKAKRIGNAQRLFFRQFFKMLFWPESGTYLNLYESQFEAYKGAVRIGI